MRSKVKTVLVALLAVFALGAAASASASAEVCGVGESGGDVALCIAKEEIASPGKHGKMPFGSKIVAGTVVTLTMTGGPTIVCKTANDEGEFDRGTSGVELEDSFNPEGSDVKLIFSQCEVANAKTKCEVVEPIVIDGGGDNLDATFKEADNEHVTFRPSTGTLWTRLTIRAKQQQECALAITEAELTGEQECELPEAAVEKVEHEVKCNTTGSKLKFAGKTYSISFRQLMTLTGANLGKKWSVIKS
jgi:hypothetical protein